MYGKLKNWHFVAQPHFSTKVKQFCKIQFLNKPFAFGFLYRHSIKCLTVLSTRELRWLPKPLQGLFQAQNDRNGFLRSNNNLFQTQI